jgi:hypothetical protein
LAPDRGQIRSAMLTVIESCIRVFTVDRKHERRPLLNTVPGFKVGQNFFFGVTAIYLRVNTLSCLALRIFGKWTKAMCHRYDFFMGNGHSGDRRAL